LISSFSYVDRGGSLFSFQTQWLSTIFITTIWVISVSGWSVAKRAYTLTDVGSNVELGCVVAGGKGMCDDRTRKGY
jgi:hypothetical protein